MSAACGSEKLQKLNQQVSVMRKEIKNLRETLDSATRAHRKHIVSLQSTVSNIDLKELCKAHTQTNISASPVSVIQTVPIGYLSSCFSAKNGTPRQPTICGPSRAELRIEHRVFNNPEHALVGLEQYSHVWIIFVFHKNGHLSAKAKVKPPRLNGKKVGVYSTRSPHRPNALGLTLAKLDKVEGPKFKFLRSTEEAIAAIRGVLSADPRSVYRRGRCTDKLFYFTLDTADVTCWFGQNFAEVLQIRPVQQLNEVAKD
uniref:TsaA-like domain-containing protein n=1 Tax=Periophthalmus magnuspinnatus TaxID=409849 RepID=A0A3B3ZAB9_9GOBI